MFCQPHQCRNQILYQMNLQHRMRLMNLNRLSTQINRRLVTAIVQCQLRCTMSRQPQCGTEDKSELAEMQIANARRRQRAAISAKAEQECRADNPNIFNNVVYEPNTKSWVVHERRTKSYQQKRKSDQH